LRERIEKREVKNITPVLGPAADPLLPGGACDLILIVDTYHHFPDRPAYLRRLVSLLKPEGRVANVDFHKRPTPVGPEVQHRVAREEFLHDAKEAGLAVAAEPTFLENQYFIILRRRK
jgi:ubiquinone/menaquinone biosynthesis C-methylase UbiE